MSLGWKRCDTTRCWSSLVEIPGNTQSFASIICVRPSRSDGLQPGSTGEDEHFCSPHPRKHTCLSNRQTLPTQSRKIPRKTQDCSKLRRQATLQRHLIGGSFTTSVNWRVFTRLIGRWQTMTKIPAATPTTRPLEIPGNPIDEKTRMPVRDRVLPDG